MTRDHRDHWELVIGLEVHAQLMTQSKLFSPAPVAVGAEPNTLVNEICAGMPGVLPVLNREAVAMAHARCSAHAHHLGPPVYQQIYASAVAAAQAFQQEVGAS